MGKGHDDLPSGLRYRAFLSYRGSDRKAAAWLHQRLERFRTPKDLVGDDGYLGPVPARIGRVFMDREEARTAADVETILAGELQRSQQLIVVCSPAAAAPDSWVSREIEIFRERRPGAEIHAIIAEGPPPLCFPPPLLTRGAGGVPKQPLAADMQSPSRGGDGRERAAIKLIASIIGVEFDTLWRRERRRARARAAQVGFAAMLIAAVAAYGVLYNAGASRARAFAAASTYEYNEGNYDRAALLALSGLPPQGSIISLFWPKEPEQALRRLGQQDLQDELTPPGLTETAGLSWRSYLPHWLKRDFILTRSEQGLYETNILTGETLERPLHVACSRARIDGADECQYWSFDVAADASRLVLAHGDGAVSSVDQRGLDIELAPPRCSALSFEVPGDNSFGGMELPPDLVIPPSYAPNPACDPAEVAISDNGRYAIALRRSGEVTVFDIEYRTQHTHPGVDFCEGDPSPDDCRVDGPAITPLRDAGTFLLHTPHRAQLYFGGSHLTYRLPQGAAFVDAASGVYLMVRPNRQSFVSVSAWLDETTGSVTIDERPSALSGCEDASTSSLIDELRGCTITAITGSAWMRAVALSDGDILVNGRTEYNEEHNHRIETECQVRQPGLFERPLTATPGARACRIERLHISYDGAAIAALDSQSVLNVYRIDLGELNRYRYGDDPNSDGALLATIQGVGNATFNYDGDELFVVTSDGARRRYRIPLAEGERRWPGAGGVRRQAYRSPHGQRIRAGLCARMGDRASAVTQLSEEAFNELVSAHPDLRLTEADRRPCERSGLFALP